MCAKYDKENKTRKYVFFAIFLLVLSSDWQWFSWYFFMLISACVLSSNDKFADCEQKVNESREI